MEISLTGLGLEGGSLLFVPVSAGICRRNRLAWMSVGAWGGQFCRPKQTSWTTSGHNLPCSLVQNT